MNEFKKLVRDLKRAPHLTVAKHGGVSSSHIRVRRSDGSGPTVFIPSSGTGEGRALPNVVANLRRNGLLPAKWERRR